MEKLYGIFDEESRLIDDKVYTSEELAIKNCNYYNENLKENNRVNEVQLDSN